jgi:hypothetical protein
MTRNTTAKYKMLRTSGVSERQQHPNEDGRADD